MLAQGLADLHMAAELAEAPERIVDGGGDAEPVDRDMGAAARDLPHGERDILRRARR